MALSKRQNNVGQTLKLLEIISTFLQLVPKNVKTESHSNFAKSPEALSPKIKILERHLDSENYSEKLRIFQAVRFAREN